MIDAQRFTDESVALLPTLHRIGVGILRSEQDAQDAVQQALMKAWAGRERVQPERFRAWLTRIVVNECRNIQRHRMRVMPMEEVASTVPFTPPDFDVTQAIEALPEKWRIPLLMKYAGQYKEKEIADALQLPVSTVKSRLFKARRALQRQLTDKEVVFE